MQLDLDAYFLPADHKVFKVFPGQGYRYYDLVSSENAVFLDIDGLEHLGLNASTWSEREVLDAVRADRRKREAFRASEGKPVPQRTGYSLDGYSRTDRRDATFAIGLFKKAKRGDLVVVPAQGYHRDVLIGELLGGPENLRIVEAEFGDGRVFRYVSRSVKWMARVPKHELPGRLINRLHTQTAFFDIGESSYEDIYDLAYKNYMRGHNFVATFRTSKARFNSRDNLLASVWFEGMSAVRASVEDFDGPSVAGKRLAELAWEVPADTERGELSININSPGEFILRSTTNFAIVVMALFALASADASASAAKDAIITAHQVGAADVSDCMGEVHDSVRRYIENLEDPGWIDACKVARAAHQVSTLTADAHVQS